MQAPDDQADTLKLDYEVVGGKSGAYVELLQIDCKAKSLKLERSTQKQQPIYAFQALLSLSQCRHLAELAAPLCYNSDNQQSGSFDVASYRLICLKNNLPSTTLSWQGTLAAAPDELETWHKYTRRLIKKLLPQAIAYP